MTIFQGRFAVNRAGKIQRHSTAKQVAPQHMGVLPAQRQFGSAPRNVTAQGTHTITPEKAAFIQTQTLYPKPVTLSYRTATGHVSASAPLRSAPTDRHPGTQTGKRVLRPYGGPPPTPMYLGDPRQIGRATVRMPVQSPPMALIPNVAKKLFGR